MMSRMSFFARDTGGSVTIELALLAPILASMLIGLVDVSTGYAHKLRLEQVAQRTIERVQQNGFAISMETTLETEAQTAAGAGASAELTWWLECDGVKVTTYASSCGPSVPYARYVQLDIQQKYTPFIMATFVNSNSDGTITVHGIAGIRSQ